MTAPIWTKDALIAAIKSGKKSVVVNDRGTYRDMNIHWLAKREGTFRVLETKHELIVQYQPLPRNSWNQE